MATPEAVHASVEKTLAEMQKRWPEVFAPDPPTWYAINQKDEDEAEVRIYDAIGAFGVTAQQFVSDLKAIGAKSIRLRLNTPGGEVFDATVIYNALREHPARVVVDVDGVAASAGSFIAMSGDEVRMADNAYLMIHDARGGVMGTAEEMRTYAEMLEKVNDNIAGMYQRKSGKSRKHYRALMSAETWFTAKEAKEEGLIDAVYAAQKKAAAPTKAAFDFAVYNKIPDAVRDMWGLPENKPTESTAPEAPAAPETVTPKPDESPRGDTEPAVQPERTPIMETPQNKPANPSAGDEIAMLNQQTIETYINKGKELGRVEGHQAALEQMREIFNVCPTRPDLAVNAFLSGQNAATVKLAYDAAQAEAAKSQAEKLELQRKVARLELINATGGHAGVAFGAPAEAGAQVPEGLDPEAQAKLEYESDPMIRAKNPDKNKWLLYRAMQLKGGVRVLSRTA